MRGHTLLETLIAMVIGSMVLTAFYAIFTHGARLYMKSNTRLDQQAEGLVVLSRLDQELRGSAVTTLTIRPADPTGPVALGFRPNVQTVPGPYVPEADFVVYYFDSTANQVVRKVWANGPADIFHLSPDPLASQRRLTAVELAQICNTATSSMRVLAKHVAAMTIAPASFPDVTLKLTSIDVFLQVGIVPETTSVHAAVTVRNP